MHLGATAICATSTGPNGAGMPPPPTPRASSSVSALSASVARHWPECSATPLTPAGYRPGWAAPGRPDDLAMGHDTQSWLAVSDDPARAGLRQVLAPPPAADARTGSHGPGFQDRLTDRLAELTGRHALLSHERTAGQWVISAGLAFWQTVSPAVWLTMSLGSCGVAAAVGFPLAKSAAQVDLDSGDSGGREHLVRRHPEQGPRRRRPRQRTPHRNRQLCCRQAEPSVGPPG